MMSEHAKYRVWDRYIKYIDPLRVIAELEEFKLEPDDELGIIIIDGVPVCFACDNFIITTVFPHPFEARESYRRLKEHTINQDHEIQRLKAERKKFFGIERKLLKLQQKFKKQYHK